MRNKNLVGTEINGLKIIDYINEGGRQYFKCICVCENIFSARIDGIKIGAVKSCGCLTGDLISQKNRLPDNQGAINLVYRHYRSNAKKRNLDFNLSLDEFRKFIFSNCNYCGVEPQPSIFAANQKYRRNMTISYNGVDRINNSLGYSLSNCVACCSNCNTAKSDSSFEEFTNWIKRLVSFNNDK